VEDVVTGRQWLIALGAATLLGVGLTVAVSLWVLYGG
jgi:hypothetical protein